MPGGAAARLGQRLAGCRGHRVGRRDALHCAANIGPFYTRIVIDIGIAMILAVSLNIVNGMTGQFSLGHAAFMALGGYAAGMVTYYGSMLLWDSTRKARRISRHRRMAVRRRVLVAGSSQRARDTSSDCRRCDCAATTWRS